jgi:hypothetical protein
VFKPFPRGRREKRRKKRKWYEEGEGRMRRYVMRFDWMRLGWGKESGLGWYERCCSINLKYCAWLK